MGRMATPNEDGQVRLRLQAPERRQRDPERTREEIMAAVVESIADVGFHRTTGAEISKRAGVSWGAVQHHFGDKNGILVAVLEDSFNRLARRLSSLDPDQPLEDRVSQLVDRAWEHFGSTHYRSTHEILLHYATESPTLEFQEQVGRALAAIWTSLFPAEELSRKRSLILQRYAVATLAGLAWLLVFGAPKGTMFHEERDILKQTLTRELSEGGVR